MATEEPTLHEENDIPLATSHTVARKWAFSSCRITGAKVAPFSSGDTLEWNEWKPSFDEVVSMNGWDDTRARRELRDSMKGTAGNITHFIDAGDLPTPGSPVLPYHGLLEEYSEAFETNTGTTTKATDTMENTGQGEGEGIAEFHIRIKMRYQRSFPNLDDTELEQSIDLARLFCAGLRDRKVGRVLFGRGGKKYLNFCLEAVILSSLADQYEEEAKWERRDQGNAGDQKKKGLYREDDNRPMAEKFRTQTEIFRNNIVVNFVGNCLDQGFTKEDLARMRENAKDENKIPEMEIPKDDEPDWAAAVFGDIPDARVISSTRGNGPREIAASHTSNNEGGGEDWVDLDLFA
jgi:hypothetical protein